MPSFNTNSGRLIGWPRVESSLELSEARLRQLALVAAFSPANCVFRALESVYGAKEAEDAFSGVVAFALIQCVGISIGPSSSGSFASTAFGLPGGKSVKNRSIGYAERAWCMPAMPTCRRCLTSSSIYCAMRPRARFVEKAINRLTDIWTLSRGAARGPTERQGIRWAASESGESRRARDTFRVSHLARTFQRMRRLTMLTRTSKVRKSVVREAFNSPSGPSSWRRRQWVRKDCDFHLSCRDILHWNLPSNPVDLEQREGRINRRDCLAIRESIARDWPLTMSTWPGRRENQGSVVRPCSIEFKTAMPSKSTNTVSSLTGSMSAEPDRHGQDQTPRSFFLDQSGRPSTNS